MYFIHKDARTALSDHRLVDKTFSRSASRALFGGAHARLGHGVSSFSKFETLSSSEYARHVRLIRFEIGYIYSYDLVRDDEEEEGLAADGVENIEGQEEVDEEGFIKLSDKAIDRLRLSPPSLAI